MTPMLRALLTALILTSATLPASAIAALPMASGDAPVLRIQGSNTINAQLTPALVEELMRQQGMQAVRSLPSAVNELRVVGTTPTGQLVSIDIAAHGSGTGFSALKAGNTDIAASSRPIKDQEAKDLAGLGDLKSAAGEQIIGIDGVAVILNPGNPLRQLDTVQLARIFSGEVKDWSEVGGNPGAIHLYVRDEKSGTYETFKELVLAKYGKQLAADALRFESSEQLSDEVSKDVNGIGFTGLPSVRHARAVAIADGESRPMLPTTSLIATEDYPLSRRLYLYVPPATHQRWAQA
ncbi:OmpA protein, partial [Pseudomonas coronafaciens pv. oryzae]